MSATGRMLRPDAPRRLRREQADLADRWTASGARDLTGPADRPGLDPPGPLVGRLDEIMSSLAHNTSHHFGHDPLDLLAERATLTGLSRHGSTSCGGGTRLLRTGDGWLALSLTRPDDIDLLPAWLQVDPSEISVTHPVDESGWDLLARLMADRVSAGLEAQAALLGLAVGTLPAGPRPELHAPDRFAVLPVRADSHGDADARPLDGANVVDLSSLWAGPLAGRLLAETGARVTKVESVARPDGARRGDPVFFDRLNRDKFCCNVDLAGTSGRAELAELLRGADVVIESSRPRALQQLGINASRLVAEGPQVWVSITGHGRSGAGASRVAFGDDAAVAGGLVAWARPDQPVFCADAIADPASGLVAAAAVARALAIGGRWCIDVAMVEVAAHLVADAHRPG